MKRFALMLVAVGFFTPVLLGATVPGGSLHSTPLKPHLTYWLFFAPPDQPQLEQPSFVNITVTTDIKLDGQTIYSSSDTLSEEFNGAVGDQASNLAGFAEVAATNGAAAVGASAGWIAGEAAGDLVLGMVPIEASVGTYAAAIGIAAVTPWVGLAVVAGGAAL